MPFSVDDGEEKTSKIVFGQPQKSDFPPSQGGIEGDLGIRNPSVSPLNKVRNNHPSFVKRENREILKKKSLSISPRIIPYQVRDKRTGQALRKGRSYQLKLGRSSKSGMVYNLDANIHKTEGKHAISSRCLDRMEVNYVTGT